MEIFLSLVNLAIFGLVFAILGYVISETKIHLKALRMFKQDKPIAYFEALNDLFNKQL